MRLSAGISNLFSDLLHFLLETRMTEHVPAAVDGGNPPTLVLRTPGIRIGS